MRVLKADDYRRMPWRNGQGETAEVAIEPTGATLDDFDWRVSMARIDGDGPFSVFAETDRTLCVLRGDGLHLSIDGVAPVELTAASEPLTFPGDVPSTAILLGATVTDLNVMTRRGRAKHSVRRLRVAGSTAIALGVPLTLLVCAQAAVRVEVDAQTVWLETLDTLLLDDAPATLSIFSDQFAVAYLIEIDSSRRG